MKTIAYIAIGSNLGDREQHLRDAVMALDRAGGNNVTAISPAYECEAMSADGESQPPYLNAVVELSTRLSPTSLLILCHDIELHAGRIRDGRKWAPRQLDLDILTYGDLTVSSPALTIPHPGLIRRRFVLAPFADIAPEYLLPHPHGFSVAAALENCDDPLQVEIRPGVFQPAAGVDDFSRVSSTPSFDSNGDIV